MSSASGPYDPTDGYLYFRRASNAQHGVCLGPLLRPSWGPLGFQSCPNALMFPVGSQELLGRSRGRLEAFWSVRGRSLHARGANAAPEPPTGGPTITREGLRRASGWPQESRTPNQIIWIGSAYVWGPSGGGTLEAPWAPK
eukprot:3578283-Pyramimonas_sp.AAC.1